MKSKRELWMGLLKSIQILVGRLISLALFTYAAVLGWRGEDPSRFWIIAVAAFVIGISIEVDQLGDHFKQLDGKIDFVLKKKLRGLVKEVHEEAMEKLKKDGKIIDGQ